MKINLTPTELIDQLRAWFHPKDRVLTLSDEQWIKSKRVAWETAVSKGQALPGLVGFWPMSSVQRSTGNVYDLSGQGRTLTYNGNPVFSIYNDFAPYIELDGTGDYLSRADETDLDILGSETIYAAAVRGLTLGGWWYFADVTEARLMTKGDGATAADSAYSLRRSAGNPVSMWVFSGGNSYSIQATTTPIGSWAYCVGRFKPSTSLDVFINATKWSNTTAIPASINNSTAAFQIGAEAGVNLLTGRAALCFLCANALSDTLINAYYQQTRSLFGV